MSREGALLAARFSFMPNRLGYCDPEENRAMLDYFLACSTRLHLALANRQRRGLALAAGPR